jgi:glycosyltransferase involved in cell wall biosynthesis
MSKIAYQPLVSIIINNFNYANYLEDAISSALNQDYPNLEVIIVDDGSTDHSRDIIKKFGTRVKPVFKKNGGQSSALNLGFSVSRGEIVCFMDSDDTFSQKKVSAIVQHFNAMEDVQWCFHLLKLLNVYSKSQIISKYDLNEGIGDFRLAIARGKKIPYIPTATSGLCFRRGFLSQLLPIPEQIKITSDNYLKFTASALGKFVFIEQELATQKLHDSNAYTLKNKYNHLKAEVAITTAYWIRVRFPFLFKFTNGLMVCGLGMFYRKGHIEDEHYQCIQNYLALNRWMENFNLKLMFFWCWLLFSRVPVKLQIICRP